LVKKKLRELPCSTTVRFKLDRLLDSLEFDESSPEVHREIRRFCQTDPELSQCIEYLKNASRDRLDRGQPASGPRWDWRQIKNIRQLRLSGFVPTEKLHRGQN